MILLLNLLQQLSGSKNMSEREKIKTNIEDIVKYWSKYIDESDISVDQTESASHCWRCGCRKNLERCHIIPYSLGGLDEPKNLVLLCKRCHSEGPNVTDVEIMWDWIKAYKVPCYETFWSLKGMKEYKFIYGKSIEDEFKTIFNKAKILSNSKEAKDIISNKIQEINRNASIHFGQPYFNDSTIAGIYRMTLKEIAKSLNIEFPVIEDSLKIPWWREI